MNRTISKRVELNETEAKQLRMKSEQCGLTESDYLRELIMNSQPVEAPPRQFYERMSELNQIVFWIQEILQKAENAIPKEMMDDMKGIYAELVRQIVSIKEIVSKARFFSTDVYERWEHDVEKAKKEGKKPLSLEEYLLETSKREIRHPATDMSLGWNALGITPPFLHGESGETDSRADSHFAGSMPNEDDWQTVDDLPVQETKQKLRELTDDPESISSYAESSILVPPRKGGGN